MATLQGNVSMPSALGVVQGNSLQGNSYNPQGFVGPTLPTSGMNTSATPGTSPKTQYIQTQAQNLAPAPQAPQGNAATQAYNQQYGFGFMNGATYNAQGQPTNAVAQQAPTSAPVQQPVQQSQPTPVTPTTQNGYGGVGASSTAYDPYNTPAYQQYISNLATANNPALSNPQIQQGLLNTEQQEANASQNYNQAIAGTAGNANLSEGALTGQNSQLATNYSNTENALQQQAAMFNQQQNQANTAAQVPLTAANTEAGFLASQAAPQTVSPGQSVVLPNLNTGTAQTQASVGSYGLGTGIAGQPITYSQTGGQVNSGGTNNTGLGSTPPSLGTVPSQYSSALQTVGQSYGLTDPASQLALQTAVANTLASNGSTTAANVPANLVPAVNAVLSQGSGGQYSPGNSAINQANLTQEQATANDLKAPATTATQHLADLQSLANAVNYTNSPIASNIRNQFSGSILTDPSITTLQSAIGVVRSEVAKVLGGGTPTVASQAEAASALPDNLSPSNIAGVIANVQNLMNQKVASYSNPANAASLPNGLQMPTGSAAGSTYNSSTGQQQAPPPGHFALP